MNQSHTKNFAAYAFFAAVALLFQLDSQGTPVNQYVHYNNLSAIELMLPAGQELAQFDSPQSSLNATFRSNENFSQIPHYSLPDVVVLFPHQYNVFSTIKEQPPCSTSLAVRLLHKSNMLLFSSDDETPIG